MAMTGGTSVLLHTGYGNNGQLNFPIRLYAYYKVSQDSSNKKSIIYLGMYVTTPGTAWDIGKWVDSHGSYLGTTSDAFNGTIPNFGGTYWIVENKKMEVVHNADGRKTATVYWKWGVDSSWGLTQNPSGSFNITLAPFAAYKLSVSAGVGSSITVNRTVCAGSGSKGNLSNGAPLWYGDILKISFAVSSNYAIKTHTVNGSTFTSGSTHTVSKNVSVVSTAKPLKSTVTATNANIGSVTTITVNRYDKSYTHTITYQFGDFEGTICEKSTDTVMQWTIPTEFYEAIPTLKEGGCRLWIQTFDKNGNIVGGAEPNTFLFTAYTVESECVPEITGSIVDGNIKTRNLTGNKNVLIRYKSTAKCLLTIIANKSATLASVLINGANTEFSESDGKYYVDSGVQVLTTSPITVTVIDSRGYSLVKYFTPVVIDYIPVTCNPIIKRTSLSGSAPLNISVKGNYYNGIFGEEGVAKQNTLSLKYRYKETGMSIWSEWQDVEAAHITKDVKSYTANFNTVESYDYKKAFNLQVRAQDGAGITELTIEDRDVIVPKSIPVFDWGEEDFSFHVPIKIGDTLLTEDALKKLLALIT